MTRSLEPVPDVALRGLGIVRVSDEAGRGEDLVSPDIQRRAIEEHCQRRGITLVGWVVGVEKAHYSGSRASSRWWVKLDGAIARVEAGEVDVIVGWKFSRAARNRRRWAVALDRIETAGGRLESATEPVDVTTPSGRFARGVIAEVNAMQAEEIGQTWKEVQARRRDHGLPHSGRGRFGYQLVDGAYVPDPDTAPILVDLYRRYLTGAGLATLARRLDSLGLVSPYSGIRYSHNGVRSLLDSGFGAGLLHVNVGTRTRPNMVWRPGSQPAVVDAATWEAYLLERDRRADLPPRLRGSVVTRVSGIARCVRCGHRLTIWRAEKTAATLPRLRCPNPTCRAVSVRVVDVEAAVLAWLPTVLEEVEAAAARAADLGNVDDRISRTRAQTVATEAADALARLTMSHARGLVPDDAYVATRDELLAERDSAQQILASLDRQSRVRADAAATAVTVLDEWDELPVDELSGMLRELVTVWCVRAPSGRGGVCLPRGAWEDPPEGV